MQLPRLPGTSLQLFNDLVLSQPMAGNYQQQWRGYPFRTKEDRHYVSASRLQPVVCMACCVGRTLYHTAITDMSLYYHGRVENLKKQHISVVRTAVPFASSAITFTSCVGTILLSLLTKPQSELPQC